MDESRLFTKTIVLTILKADRTEYKKIVTYEQFDKLCKGE